MRHISRKRRLGGKTLAVESLERRAMLSVSGTLPAVTGTVYEDLNDNGSVDPGEALEGVSIRLFTDNGDGVFLPGSDDFQVGVDTTDANGEYCFDDLSATVDYWVVQQSQSVNGRPLDQELFLISPGDPGVLVDNFDTSQMVEVEGNAPPTISDTGTINPPDSTSDFFSRTLQVNMLTSGSEMSGMEFGAIDLDFGPGEDFGGSLTFNADSGVTGTYIADWVASTPFDLTGAGTSTGLYMLAGVDANGDEALITVTSGGNSSSTTVDFIPTNQARPEQYLFVPFSSFVGSANLTQIDQVSLNIGGMQPVDGNISIFGTLETKVVDFANEPFDPNIEIEKLTNGVDADDPADGPRLSVGSGITWTYRVSNTGNDDLTPVVVTDNVLGTITNIIDRENSDNDAILEPGETWIYEAVGVAQLGDYQNIGTATGTNTAGGTVSDQDLSHYFGLDSMIDLEKSTNDVDADSAPGPSIIVGDTVTWRYVVTNPGNDDLTNVVVTDDVLGIITNLVSQTNGDTDSTLEPGEIWTYEATASADSGPYANIGSVTARNSVGSQVNDQDMSHYFGAQPLIDIQKSTNGSDADSTPGPSIPVGDNVTWTYVVTNDGNVSLTNVSVTDSDIGAVTNLISQSNGNTDDVLDPGDIWTYQETGTSVAGQYQNMATVTAFDDSVGQVSDEDLSHYFGSLTTIAIEKSTNDVDADVAPGLDIPIGDTVTWTYVVTNNGNVDLNNVVVSDSDLGVITNRISQTNGNLDDVLNPGEIWTYEATGIAVSGQYENTGMVSAVDDSAVQVTDQDLSHYFGLQLSIDIEKSTNGFDADVSPGPDIAVGDTVTWNYVVTNNGNVDLDNVVVTDSDRGVISNLISQDNGNLDDILNPGEIWTYEATSIAIMGQYENTGTVTAVDDSARQVTDQDLSHYFGSQPSIDIEKLTNGIDADDPADGEPIDVGSLITWSYVVTNTGNQDITNVSVNDDREGPITNLISQTNGDTDNILEPNEVWTYQATSTAQPGQYQNVGTVTGQGPVTPLSDSDPSSYFGIEPLIDIEKSTNGIDADLSGDGPRIPVGSSVTWTYVVTNPGNDSLTNVVVSDNLIGNITNIINRQNDNGDSVLDPGEIWTYEATGSATAGAYVNTGSATAIDSASRSVGDSDSSNYFGAQPAIDIEKLTNGFDADSPSDAPTIFIGQQVTWNYIVTNSGNEDLTNIEVNDDRLGRITTIIDQGNGNAILEPGEIWTFQETGIAVEGAYSNLGSVTALDAINGTLQDQDLSHYVGEELTFSLSGFVYVDIDNDGDKGRI